MYIFSFVCRNGRSGWHYQYVHWIPFFLCKFCIQQRMQHFGHGGLAKFWPQGEPWAQNLIKIGVFSKKNCLKTAWFWKHLGGKGEPGPLGPPGSPNTRIRASVVTVYAQNPSNWGSFTSFLSPMAWKTWTEKSAWCVLTPVHFAQTVMYTQYPLPNPLGAVLSWLTSVTRVYIYTRTFPHPRTVHTQVQSMPKNPNLSEASGQLNRPIQKLCCSGIFIKIASTWLPVPFLER